MNLEEYQARLHRFFCQEGYYPEKVRVPYSLMEEVMSPSCIPDDGTGNIRINESFIKVVWDRNAEPLWNGEK